MMKTATARREVTEAISAALMAVEHAMEVAHERQRDRTRCL